MRSEVDDGVEERLDDDVQKGELATAAAEEGCARDWDVVHAGEKPVMVETQDRPNVTAMTLIVGWRMVVCFELFSNAATGADGSWISIAIRSLRVWLIVCAVVVGFRPGGGQMTSRGLLYLSYIHILPTYIGA
jgi:hypothetical protein